MSKLRAVIERITYQSAENGYSILKANVKGYNDLVTLVGNMPEVTVGTVMVAEGEWKVNKQYSSQFVVSTYEEAMPATEFGIEKYLGSGLVKGIGPKYAKLIVSTFGLDTFDVIEKEPKKLSDVPGIGPKRIKKIHDSWMKQLDVKEVMVFLQGNGVSTAYAAKIYKAYGKEASRRYRTIPTVLPMTSGASVSRPPTASPRRWATRRTTHAVAEVVLSIPSTNCLMKAMFMPSAINCLMPVFSCSELIRTLSNRFLTR